MAEADLERMAREIAARHGYGGTSGLSEDILTALRSVETGVMDRLVDAVDRADARRAAAPTAPARSEADIRAEAFEEAAKIAEAERDAFLSPEYATGQPLSSFAERPQPCPASPPD